MHHLPCSTAYLASICLVIVLAGAVVADDQRSDKQPPAKQPGETALRLGKRLFLDKRLANPAFHIHGHNVPASDLAVPFSMLLNLASAASADDKASRSR